MPELSTILPARISLGGAYLRIWRSGQGLTVEMPLCVVQDTETGAIVSFGEEAAQMQGKLPRHTKLVRPFFADTIQDRLLLRGVIEAALAQDRQQMPVMQKIQSTWNYQVVLPPTVSTLHQNWLKRTFSEAGLLRWQVTDSWRGLVATKFERLRSTPVAGVLDLGFSAARAAVYVGSDLTWSQKSASLSFAGLCESMVQFEEEVSGIRFAPSVLFDQQWSRQQPGFDTKLAQAVIAPLNKKTVPQVLSTYTTRIAEFLLQTQRSIPDELQAQLQQYGWIVIGGGATLPEIETELSQLVGSPLHFHRHPKYAELRTE